jgi:hypothetical protein
MNSGPQTRAGREAALDAIGKRLRADPLSVGLALDWARLLAELDRTDEARDAYLRLVARTPDDPRVLTDFGTFLMRTGFRAAARTVYERAVAAAPHSALAHANLANVLFADNDYDAARLRYEAALEIDPAYAPAHQGLSYALTRLGRDAEAEVHRRRGFAGAALTTAPYRGTGEPVDVLLCVCAAGGTLYTESFLDDRVFRTTTLVADAYDGTPLPPADVVFNAISDADRAEAALVITERALAGNTARVINAPARVLATGRVANAARLGTLEDVVAPHTAAVSLAALRADPARVAEEHGFAFPLLARAPGFHTGQHFVKVDRAAGMRDAVAGFPGDDALLLAFADLRGGDGQVRKYRVMAIDGQLYPLHAAIGTDWKVHYFTADMAGNAANRTEDERFLADPRGAIGGIAWAALERVQAMLGLEYAGIYFGVDNAGRAVIFEANATMIVLPPGADPMWAYRREPVERVIAAVRAMLRSGQ